MAAEFPAAIPAFTNPSAGNKLGTSVGGLTHVGHHAKINDEIEAIAAKLGISAASPDDTPNSTQVLVSDATGTSKWSTLQSGNVSFVYGTFTPSLNQGGAVAATVNEAFYLKLGTFYHVHILMTPTAAGTGSNPIQIILPTGSPDLRPGGSTGFPKVIGEATYLDTGVGARFGAAFSQTGTAQNIRIQCDGKADALGTASDALTIASGDVIGLNLIFEGA